MAGEKDDLLDELMPDPEEAGGTAEELDIEVVREDDGQGVRAPERVGEESEEDAGTRLAQEDEEDADLEPEDKKLPKSVKERIRREKRLRVRQVESERAGRETLEAKLAASEANVVEARLVATIALAREQELKGQILQDKIIKATEAGKTEDVVKLQAELSDAQANLREAKANQARLEELKAHPPAPTVENPYVAEWKSKNTWCNDKEFSGDWAKVLEIDQRLAASKKFNPRSPQYFEELDRLVHEELPRLRVRAREAGLTTSYTGQRQAPQPRRDPPRSPVAPAGERQASSRPAGSKTKVVLTAADLENMARFKMDPTNPKHLQQYAREKIAAGG